jgi:hypothetical protein
MTKFIVGVVIIFLEVCTFGISQSTTFSSNNETTVIKNSSIFDETTETLRIESQSSVTIKAATTATATATKTTKILETSTETSTTLMFDENFQLPENCSDYKVINFSIALEHIKTYFTLDLGAPTATNSKVFN